MNKLRKISSVMFALILGCFVTISLNSCGTKSTEESDEAAVEETSDSTSVGEEHPEGEHQEGDGEEHPEGEHPEGSEHPEGEHPEGEHPEGDDDSEEGEEETTDA